MAHEFVPHVFAQGHTIEGAIRLHNSLRMLPEQVEMMVVEFNEINKDVFPPVAGQVVKIPVMTDQELQLVPEPKPKAAPKVKPVIEPVVEPVEEPTIEAPPKLPPLRQPMRKIVRQIPKKKEKKKVTKKLQWWK